MDVQALANELKSNSSPDPDAVFGYDALSDAVVYSDERPQNRDCLGSLRLLWNHRTMGVIGRSDLQTSEGHLLWESLKELAPDWVGFRAERCRQDKEIASFYESRPNISDQLDQMDEAFNRAMKVKNERDSGRGEASGQG